MTMAISLELRQEVFCEVRERTEYADGSSAQRWMRTLPRRYRKISSVKRWAHLKYRPSIWEHAASLLVYSVLSNDNLDINVYLQPEATATGAIYDSITFHLYFRAARIVAGNSSGGLERHLHHAAHVDADRGDRKSTRLN